MVLAVLVALVPSPSPSSDDDAPGTAGQKLQKNDSESADGDAGPEDESEKPAAQGVFGISHQESDSPDKRKDNSDAEGDVFGWNYAIADPAAHLHHNEPLLRDGEIIGFLTSGGCGHALGGAIGLGYVPCVEPNEPVSDMLESAYQIEIAGRRYEAEVSAKPMHDPKSLRPKA